MKTALFDFDGVLVDTEPIYDIFWDEAAIRYNLNIENFSQIIKGTTMADLMETYFSNHTEEFREMVIRESSEYENSMPLPPMPGAFDFLETLKENNVSIGLVTSSDIKKINRAIEIHKLQNLFNTIVTADRITNGKPDPMCYLLAASDLQVDPKDCLVFEDSFAGIQSGSDAGMRVIGLSSTNPKEELIDKVYEVIPNFENLTIKDYRRW